MLNVWFYTDKVHFYLFLQAYVHSYSCVAKIHRLLTPNIVSLMQTEIYRFLRECFSRWRAIYDGD